MESISNLLLAVSKIFPSITQVSYIILNIEMAIQTTKQTVDKIIPVFFFIVSNFG